MPEFEETSTTSNPSHNYTPSADAKPRTRRRSGGFKKEISSAPKGNMGEVNPVDALKSEKLTGSADESATDTPQAKPVERKKRTERQGPREQRERREDKQTRGNPEPSEATLAAIRAVEARIAERKAERDARYDARKKARATETRDKPKPKADGKHRPHKQQQPARKKDCWPHC